MKGDKMTDWQHIYIYMDDSGKISRFEDYAIFAGIVFSNNKMKSEFVNKYRQINREIHCKYCKQALPECNHDCPEVKAISIDNSDRRRIINLSKKHVTFGTVIMSKTIQTKDIFDRPQSKGRFNEYAQRRIIKKTMQYLISKKIVNPNKPVYLHLNIDKMPTKTNGYYTLQEGIREEFIYGIINFNYQRRFSPILFGDFEIDLRYKDSKTDFGIQMADILANTIRRAFIHNGNYYEVRDYLSKKMYLNVLLRLPN